MDIEHDLFYEKNKFWDGNSQVTLKGIFSLFDPINIEYDNEFVLEVDDEEFVIEPMVRCSGISVSWDSLSERKNIIHCENRWKVWESAILSNCRYLQLQNILRKNDRPQYLGVGAFWN